MDRSGQGLTFVVGHYKAGSTWLLRLLCLHPQVRGLAETHVFHHVRSNDDLLACSSTLFEGGVPWSAGGHRRWLVHRLERAGARVFRPGARLPLADRPATLLDLGFFEGLALRRRLAGATSGTAYLQEFFGFLHDRLRPGAYLLEKTPRNIRYVPFIREVFPEARLLAVHRDGRDVCVSDRFFRERRSEPWSLEASARRWRQDMEAQEQFKRQYGLHAVSYEALHSDPRPVVADMLEYLGLSADAALLERMISQSSFESTTGRKRGAEQRRSFNRKGVVGDWRNHFSDVDRETFKRLANDTLIALGYERDANW